MRGLVLVDEHDGSPRRDRGEEGRAGADGQSDGGASQIAPAPRAILVRRPGVQPGGRLDLLQPLGPPGAGVQVRGQDQDGPAPARHALQHPPLAPGTDQELDGGTVCLWHSLGPRRIQGQGMEIGLITTADLRRARREPGRLRGRARRIR
jgi:hypothetical protein